MSAPSETAALRCSGVLRFLQLRFGLFDGTPEVMTRHPYVSAKHVP